MEEKEPPGGVLLDYWSVFWVALARFPYSLPVETDADKWMAWVTKPIIQSPLAPREARAILEVFGRLASQGREIGSILADILERYDIENVRKFGDWL